eukprot:15061508-Heterocapsa_arctica.AAC.1
MTTIRWVKAHLKKEKSHCGWSQKYYFINKVTLAKNAQTHLLKNYITYINHPLVRKDTLDNKKIKGTPTGTKCRPIIRPEQMGHEVQICGDS